MPQMSPMSWTMLMIMFIVTLIMINSIFYFNKKYNILSSKKIKTKKNMNWQW